MENKQENDDLRDLKAIWNADFQKKTIEQPFIQQQNLSTIMKQQTSSVQRIRRNLLIEILTTIPMMVGIYWIAAYKEMHFHPAVWAALIVLTFGYHVYLYFNLNKKEQAQEKNVLTSVHATVSELRGFMRMYEVTAWVLAAIMLAVVTGLTMLVSHWAVGLLLGSFTALGAFTAVKWYVNKLYGQHYAQLQACEKELMEG